MSETINIDLSTKQAALVIDRVVEEMNKLLGEPHYQNLESTERGIETATLGNSPEQCHGQWCAQRRMEGWKYGEVKSKDALTHPCLVPYDKLPVQQKMKDCVMIAIGRLVSDRQILDKLPIKSAS